MRVWIEICVKLGVIVMPSVTLYVRVWIEIKDEAVGRKDMMSPSA